MDRVEATGVGISVVGHGAVLAVLAFGLLAFPREMPPSSAIEVSFVDEVGLVSAAPELNVAPPEQGMAPEIGPAEDAPPAPSEAAPPLPEPRPAPAAPQPAPKQAAPTPARTPPAEPRQARTPARPRQAGTAGSGERTQRSRLGDDLLKGLGDDPSPSRSTRPAATMTGAARASINAAIERALRPCQRQPLPAPEADSIQVQIAVTLNRDGRLASARVIKVTNNDYRLRQYEQRMRDLALAVIRQCTPIRGLPPELYDVPRGWRQFNFTFDPRQIR